jgi:hypothetical protein
MVRCFCEACIEKSVAAQGFLRKWWRIKSVSKVVQKSPFFLNKMRVKTVSKDALLCKQKHSKTQAVLEDNLWLQAGKVLMWDARFSRQLMGHSFGARGSPVCL